MIRIWRAPWSTNCERVSLALGHKGLEAESVLIDYADRSEVERVSGQGLVPVIEDDGEIVADSTRILRHLEERCPDPPLFPPEEKARVHCDLFLEWFDEVWKRAPNAIEAELERDSPDQALVAGYARTMEMHLDVFERMLTGDEFLLAEFSAADCVAYPFVKYAAGREDGDDELFHVILDERQSVEGRPRLAGWIERVGATRRAF